MIRIRVVLLPLLLLFPQVVWAQTHYRFGDFSVDQWTIQNGLPTNVLRDITATPDGFLWVASYSGLARFDGMRFETFDQTNTPGMRSSRVRRVLADAQGRVWFNALNSSFVIEDGSIRRLQDNSRRVMSTWSGTAAPMWILSPRTIERRTGDELEEWPIEIRGTVQIDGDGVLWGIRQPGSSPLGRLEGARWIEEGDVVSPNGALIPRRNGVHYYRDSLVTVATREGTSTLPVGQVVAQDLLTLAQSASGAWLPREVLRHSDGTTWIAMSTGLYRTQVDPFGVPPPMDSGAECILPEQVVGSARALLEGENGVVWVATDTEGLWRVAPAIALPLEIPPGWQTPNYQMTGHVPFLLGMNKRRQPVVIRNLSGSVVLPIPASGRGLPTSTTTASGGVLLLPDAAVRIEDGSLVKVADISADPVLVGRLGRLSEDGTIMTRTEEGIFRVLDGRVQNIGPGRRIWATPDGSWWVNRRDSLTEYGTSTPRPHMLPGGQPPGEVRDLWQDPWGRVWIATHGSGLACLRGDATRVATTQHGLPDNTVGGMLADDSGRLWVNSNRGIFVVPIESLDRFARSEIDYLPCRLVTHTESGTSWAARGDDGLLYFMALQGIVRVDPAQYSFTPAPPQAQVVETTLADRHIDHEPMVLLPLGERVLSIRYTAPSLTEATQVRFRYRLDNDEWHYVGKRREVTLANIQPGKHRFEVVAANASGKWAVAGDSVFFHTPPYAYETVWFKTSIALTLLCFLYGAYRIRRRVQQRHLNELEDEIGHRRTAETSVRVMGRRLMSAQEDERARIARELHDDVNQRLSVLAMELDMMRSGRSRTPEVLSREVQELSDDVHRLSHSLHPGRIEQLGLEAALRGLVEEMCSEDMTVQFDSEFVPETLPPQVAIAAFRIAQESVRNADKYAGGGLVVVSLRGGDGLVLEISDCGRGFDMDDPPNSGLGFTSMSERAAALGGSLVIQSAPGRGTTIRATFPGIR